MDDIYPIHHLCIKHWKMGYVSMKEGCLFGFVLFCLYLSDPPNEDGSDHVLGLFVKLFDEDGCICLVSYGVCACGVEVLEY